MRLFMFCDGGAIGNPGPAAIGAVVKDEEGRVLKRISKYIGKTTNNQAEYRAVIEALLWTKSNIKSENADITVFLDSELITNQLNLKYKVKNSQLQSLFLKVYNLTVSFKKVQFKYIPREKNKEADWLVKKILKNT